MITPNCWRYIEEEDQVAVPYINSVPLIIVKPFAVVSDEVTVRVTLGSFVMVIE